MAIDTENKRRSALGRRVLPRPDGTISTADRQHKVWKYAGISAEVAPDIPGLEYTIPVNRIHFTIPINRHHFTSPVNQTHFVIPEDNNE